MYDLDLAILKAASTQNSFVFTDLMNKVCASNRRKKYDAETVRFSIQKLCRTSLLHSSSLNPSAFDAVSITAEGRRAVLDETETRWKNKVDFWKNHFVNFIFGFLSGVLVGVVTTLLVSWLI